MDVKTVLHGQTIFDMAVQHCGDLSAAWDLAKMNNRSVSDDLTPGEQLYVPDPVNVQMANFFTNKLITIATKPQFDVPAGIGQGRIGIDFQIL